MSGEENPFLKSFQNAEAVAAYHSGPKQFTPGLEALHRMVAILLEEVVPADARILVLGAGGGLELKALADRQPGWSFEGVDPAGPMLKLARETLGEHANRVQLIEGYIDDATAGPFDGAVCLLTLHFLAPDERNRTEEAVRNRLKPGAPFVVAHACLPRETERREAWLDRYAAFARSSGAPAEKVAMARAAVSAADVMLPPEEDVDILRQAGFSRVEQFYAAFTWHGWVGYA
ncbi:class I SAM-dependent methyltransferase [Henriciella algicola]|uniref:Class I SAM-dependent methyltransferase n=1 Tax=Henriciella algicola TaxID=1608422 RepID=A0A399RBT2_9PROT|nr:class I SAM-dependent methyltransferase [Henriciella algicola]RIJ27385.1 class I SAM-dependent methyltransferase [Henriciella algicola]